MPLSKTDTIIVTGASGKFGRRVVEHLMTTYAVPAGQIIAATRKPEALADLAGKGVTVRAADFDDEASLARAFRGATRLLIISTDAMDRPGRRLEQHFHAVSAAKSAGIKHIVYTSMPDPKVSSPIPFAGDHRGTEEAIAASGIAHTILRNSWYMENLLMSLPAALAAGQWVVASGEGKTSHTAREDQARTAAAVLASGSSDSATYTLTGPEALSADETAKIVSDVLGKPLQVVHVTPDQLKVGLIAHGVPDFLAPLLVSFDVNTLEGNIGMVTDAIKKLSGSKPQTLRQWLGANRGQFGV
jgi:NAD(P)H dehydrogenase (quinone)